MTTMTTMTRPLGGGGGNVIQKSYVSIVLLLILVLTISTNQVEAEEICTPCEDGTDFRLAAPQPLCDDLLTKTNGLFGTDQECLNVQLTNYQNGCCSNPPFDYCTFCDDPKATPNLDLYVPTGQFADPYNCYEYSYQNEALIGMFSDGKCEDTFMRRAGHYCGCGSEQKQECYLCPDGRAPTKPQRMDSWITNSNCRGIEYLFSLLREDECSSFPYSVGADLGIYCGCDGINQTEIEEQAELYTCTLCENGGTVTNPNTVYNPTESSMQHKTCRQAQEFASTVMKTPAGCRNPNYFGLAREVCTCSESAGSAVVGSMMMMPFVVTTAVAGSLLLLLL
jgi:hypothetical protein